ncbi:F-box protein At4g09920-like [Silene latifolia]|uniref:F-box protein At4g09920-like n=1 Tax=Silene latifolia TaxID=37657 RepID=UPI003D76EA14
MIQGRLTRRQKHETETRNEEINEDIISELPNSILNLILSLIPTKSVITTSLVSKRFQQISTEYLTYANNYDFSEDFSKNHTQDESTKTLNTILTLNKSHKIDKFKLIFSPRNKFHKSNVVNWIEFAVLRDIKEFDLDFCRHIHIHFLTKSHIIDKHEIFELPGFLFDCKSLETVKLRRCILTLPGNYTGFSELTTLYLKEVHILDEMLENIFQNCKILEEVVLKECGSLSRIRILSPVINLRKLTVYECYNASIIDISGPNIRSLLISCGHLDSCKLENMPLLENVFIGTRGDEFGGVMYIFMEVLSSFAHVKSLTLYLGHLVPSLFKDFKVNFSNLEELVLVNCPLFGLFNTDVYCFFKHCSCPSLKKITIELSTVSKEDNFVCEFRKPNVEPIKTVFNNLRDVKLLNFRGTSTDMELAIDFLTKSPNLETMYLVTPRLNSNVSRSTSNGDETFEGMQRVLYHMLLDRPVASPTVDVRIVNDINNQHNILSSIFKWHHVYDVYYKLYK